MAGVARTRGRDALLLLATLASLTALAMLAVWLMGLWVLSITV